MFSSKLKELRKKNGITQIEFARKMNVANGTVGNWESGTREPDFDMLTKIAEFFGVSVDYLLSNAEIDDITPTDELTEYLEELKNRSEMRTLFSLAKGATKEDVMKAVAIIEALRKTDG